MPVQDAALRILVAEDNAMNRRILREILTRSGFEADCVINGREAVERFTASAAGAYALILTDVQMPLMDGYAAARAIRASAHPQAKSIPIAALTTEAGPSDVAEALNSGMNAHIAKPIEVDVLLATLRRLLRGAPEA